MASAYTYEAGRGPKRHRARVGNFVGATMVGLAVLFDAVQFLFSFFHVIPIVGNGVAVVIAWYVAVFSFIVFGLWFALLGVNYFTGKRAGLKLVAAFSMFVIEIIPLLDALPAITAGVVTMIVASRIEDLVGNEKNIENLSSRGKLAAAASLTRGVRVSERDARAGDTERLAGQIGGLSRATQRLNLDLRSAERREREQNTQEDNRRAV